VITTKAKVYDTMHFEGMTTHPTNPDLLIFKKQKEAAEAAKNPNNYGEHLGSKGTERSMLFDANRRPSNNSYAMKAAGQLSRDYLNDASRRSSDNRGLPASAYR